MNLSSLKSATSDQPSYRYKQAYQFIFKHLIESWDEAMNLPKLLREELVRICPLDINAQFFDSQDKKTTKALVTLEDGNKIETVLMRHSDIHNTVCVSCQVGCAMGCDFCATGKLGMKKNLTSDEILMQVLCFARMLKKENHRISNVVFMGMGEPLLNYENVMDAIKILNDEDGLNIAARKISISTCGIIPGIEKLADEPLQLNLALSLHSPDDSLRSRLMPINNQFHLEKVLSAISNYLSKTGRKVMIEYIMLKDINDSEEDAKKLAEILKEHLGRLFMVNLILYNITENDYRPSDENSKNIFRRTLENDGIEVTQRFRLGHDIAGACGQLAGKEQGIIKTAGTVSLRR